ncbi:hypothetical protein BDQ17DRAFT_1423437 [Cyathus striatus]|nr:hypothetical protein BDQ17DRAFT_1423437 [Cyathus striatus]
MPLPSPPSQTTTTRTIPQSLAHTAPPLPPHLTHSPVTPPPLTGPPEVLIHTLKYLYLPTDLFSCLRVSRTWCECVVELLWQKPAFPKVSTLHKMVNILKGPNNTFNYSSFVRRLNFATIGDALRDDLFTMFARCIMVERLTLTNCRALTTHTLCQVLPSFSHVLALDLTGVEETTDDAIIGVARSATRLQGMNLFGCSKVTDNGIMALAQNCPLLRRVKLSGLELLTDESLAAIAKSCPLLLELDLNRCSLITDVSVREIWTHCTQLRELRLSHCPALTDAAFPAPALSHYYSSLPTSNSIPLRVGRDLDDLPPLVLPHRLESLRMLDLTPVPASPMMLLTALYLMLPRSAILFFPNVICCQIGRWRIYVALVLISTTFISDMRTRSQIARCAYWLDPAHVFDMSISQVNCHLLTDMAVFELSSLPKLRRIGLVRVTNLTDEAVYALAERHATLERIHLSYCDQITVMAVHFLLLKLHKLTHLSLSGVPAFRQPELQRFCREAPREFNDAQRASFCVYSGKGISQLRAYLTELFDRITEMNGTDDTDYEEDEFDDHYAEEDTPEPDTDSRTSTSSEWAGTVTSRQMRHSKVRCYCKLIPVFGPIPSHACLRSRHFPSDSSSNSCASAYRTTQSTTSAAGPSRRTRGYMQNNARRFSDAIPIVEGQSSPPPTDIASNHSAGTSASNGASFFHMFNREGPVTSTSARNEDGALTPDLNFAEIGHGRGMGLHPMRRNGEPRRVQGRAFGTGADSRSSMPPNFGSGSQPQTQTSITPSATGPSPNNVIRELQDSIAAALGRQGRGRTDAGDEISPLEPSSGNGGRGRSVRRGLRNTLHAAEHYATSLFGRDPTDTRSEPSSSGRRGH